MIQNMNKSNFQKYSKGVFCVRCGYCQDQGIPYTHEGGTLWNVEPYGIVIYMIKPRWQAAIW